MTVVRLQDEGPGCSDINFANDVLPEMALAPILLHQLGDIARETVTRCRNHGDNTLV